MRNFGAYVEIRYGIDYQRLPVRHVIIINCYIATSIFPDDFDWAEEVPASVWVGPDIPRRLLPRAALKLLHLQVGDCHVRLVLE